MAAPREYPDEVRERAVRLVLDAEADPATGPAVCRRISEQLGINLETLRGWVSQAEVDAGDRPGGPPPGSFAVLIEAAAWIDCEARSR